MTGDARFEDGEARPLRLRALDPEDLAVISSLCQDAILPASEMRWERRARRFALLVNRFRWEAGAADPERVQSVLAVEDVAKVQSLGLPRGDGGTVLSLLSISWQAGPDGTGRLHLTFSGDGAIALDVEALEVVLQDVTRPWPAPSRRAPGHPGDEA